MTNKQIKKRDSTVEEVLITSSDKKQSEVILINKPTTISEFLHDKKTEILHILIEGEKTIRELSEYMNLNPGTIKRYLDSLIKNGLVFQTKITQNQWGIRLKYYKAAAKRYIINMEFPKKRNDNK